VLDLVALIPIARGVRIFRLLRLLRLIRAFTGFRRAFLQVELVANHHGLGTLVIAWFGTMLLCSWAFLLAESGPNPRVDDAGDAVWWGLMTLTGGPSNIQAVTPEGQWITAILLIVGVALFTAITAVLVSFLVTTDRKPGFADDLRSLEAARAEGAITKAEFEQTKAAILARLQRAETPRLGH
jgi:voltage-gated potassium channel